MEKSTKKQKAEIVGRWKDATPVTSMKLKFNRPCVYNLNNSLAKCFDVIKDLFVAPDDPARIHYQKIRDRIIDNALTAIQTVYN